MTSNPIGFSAIAANPVFTYAPDVSPEFQSRLEQYAREAAKTLDGSYAITALGGDTQLPFSATRDGEKVHVVFPLTVQKGDLLGNIITLLAAQIPTCILHEGTVGWNEPEWTAESRSHLAGIVSAIRSAPDSFAHGSHPTDLARAAVWVSLCSSALSIPGGVKDAQGDVLPSVLAGGKSASKYMTRIMQSLKSNITDESTAKAIETLAILLKLWQKSNASRGLDIVRKCKLSWSSVLFRGAPTEVIKGKRGKPDQRVTRSPPKPSRSPWLAAKERSELSEYFKSSWSGLDSIRSEWTVLNSIEQHKQFNSFVKRVKTHFEELNNISNSVHAKLGKRKHWIEAFCKEQGFKPNKKKKDPESFQMADHFFKQDLSAVNLTVVKVFAPVTYLPDPEGRQTEIWSSCFPSSEEENWCITSANFTKDNGGEAFKLWQIWADLFKPRFTSNRSQDKEALPVSDSNIFSRLLGLSRN